jgi:hypothetical protein
MTTETVTTEEKKEQRPFFYYPGSKTNRNRQVIAGIIGADGKIHVGISQCFSGCGKRPGGVKGHEWEPAKCADQFNKKVGREIALGRALKGKTILVIDVPQGEVKLGKLFVTEVEKAGFKSAGTLQREAEAKLKEKEEKLKAKLAAKTVKVAEVKVEA